jgi:hypothetical protein
VSRELSGSASGGARAGINQSALEHLQELDKAQPAARAVADPVWVGHPEGVVAAVAEGAGGHGDASSQAGGGVGRRGAAARRASRCGRSAPRAAT